MTIDDMDYQEIETGILGPTPCSPAEPADPLFRGILINAPHRVAFQQSQVVPQTEPFAKIPICGYYHIDVVYPPPYPSILDGMRLVAVNRGTKERYVGRVIDRSDAVPPPPEDAPFTQAELEGISVAAYFNPNLLEFVPLPQIPGVYDVFIELGDRTEPPFYRSNRVTIEIVNGVD